MFEKNGYNHHIFHKHFVVIENKLIFCNVYNIIMHMIKPVLKYGPCNVDSFEKKINANI